MRDAEGLAQVFEEFGVADFAPLMPLPGIIGLEPSDQLRGLAAGMSGPNGRDLAEIDIEHDAAEIEQQRVGGAGEKRGIHPPRLQNRARSGNGR